MPTALSPRLMAIVDALPLKPGMRVLEPGEAPYDLAVAIRVGALDGRHPEAGVVARQRIKAALKPGGTVFIDGGDPLREVPLR